MVGLTLLLLQATVCAQTTLYTDNSTTSAWNTSRWSTSPSGPFTSAWTANATAVFNEDVSLAGVGSIALGNITVSAGVTVNITTDSGTPNTGSQIRTINVGAGGLLNFGSQDWTTSGSTGFIKEGAGAYYTLGDTYGGGFTVNDGYMIARGVNAMGNGGSLTFNGGAIGADGNEDFGTRYTGITVGGDFTIGVSSADVGVASSTANLTFANAVSLGAATRTITIGANGTYSFDGVVSGGSGAGLTVAAAGGATGALVLGGANTFNGSTTVSGGTLKLGVSGSLSSDSALVISDGGTFDATATTFNIGTAGLTMDVGASTAGFLNAGTITLGNGLTIDMGTATPSASYNLWDFSSNSGNFSSVSLSGSFGGSLSRSSSTWSGSSGNYTFTLNQDTGILSVVENAADLYWTADGSSLGGTGTWNGTNTTWSTSNSSISGGVWNAASTAVFEGTAGTVTVGTISANAGVTFKTDGYTLSSGTLTLGAASDVANAITVDTGLQATINTVLAGTNGMTKAGAGTLVLGGANTYTGGTNVNGGILQGTTGSLQGDIANNAAVVFDQSTTGTYSGNISGIGTLTKNGSGSVTLSGSNTYSGATILNAGTLVLGSNTAIGDGSAVTINGGTFDVGSSSETVHSVSMSGGAITIGTGTLTLDNASSLTGGTVTLAGSVNSRLNTSGTTTLGDVEFVFNNGSNANDGRGLVLGGNVAVNAAATANFTNAGAGVGRIELNGDTTIDVGAGGTMDVAWHVDEFGGTRTLTKNGSGTLVLSGTGSFAGTTTVNNGTLEAGGAGALGSTSGIVVNTGGSLLVSASNAVGDSTGVTLAGGNLSFSGTVTDTIGVLTLSANSTIDLGSGSVVATFSNLVMNGYTLDIYNWSGNTLWDPTPGGGTDQVIIGTALGDSDLQRINFYSGAGSGFLSTAFQLGDNEIIAVPEPGTWITGALLLGGLALLVVRRRGALSAAKHE